MSAHTSLSPPRSLSITSLTLIAIAWTLLPACARIQERRGLRVQPLEQPKVSMKIVGQGYQLRAKRIGDVVQVQVAAAHYCQRVISQRAQGFRVVQRETSGQSLLLEWVFGGLIGATGGGIVAWNLTHPAAAPQPGEFTPDTSKTANIYGGVIAAVGLGLLTGAIVQQASLGKKETPLGLRTLHKRGRVQPCKLRRATKGELRLTLSDGLQIVTKVGRDGLATLPLPADLERRLKRERKATLEAIGDWRSQTRVEL